MRIDIRIVLLPTAFAPKEPLLPYSSALASVAGFEGVCRQAIVSENPVKSADAGREWEYYREDGERRKYEIGILSVNKGKKQVLFGECKWKEYVDWKGVLLELKKKTEYTGMRRWKWKEQYVIFAKSFRKKEPADENVLLFDLESMGKKFRGRVLSD